MSSWLDGSKAGWYRQSSGAWHNYANFGGQFNGDDVYYNQTLSLTVNPADTISAFRCNVSNSFSGSGGTPPYTARIQAIRNSTSLVTDAASALDALSHLTTAFLDITFSTADVLTLDLTTIAQEVVNESHWASGNKITFVCQGTAGFGGTTEVFPTWYSDFFSVGGGGGGGTGGQNGVNGSFFLMLMEDPQ